MKYFPNLYKGRHILFSLVKRDLKGRYRGTILGIAWSLLTPLGLVIIIGTVFSLLWDMPMRVFIPYLFSGLMPWLYISACAQGGTNSFLSSQGYIKQTQTPIEIFPVRTALVEFVNLIFSLLVFICLYFVLSPEKFNIYMLLSFVALILWAIFGAAIATISALINTYIRDYSMLQSLIIQGLFYVTPIVWQPDILAQKGYNLIYELNPLYYMLEILRKPLLGDIPDISNWFIALTITILVAFIAIASISKVGRKIIFRL